MARGGKRPGAGRKKGVPGKRSQDLRDMMESVCKGEPIPVVLLKLGLNYHTQGLHAEAVRAIGEACQYAYQKLKAVEHTGKVDSVQYVAIVPEQAASVEAWTAANATHPG